VKKNVDRFPSKKNSGLSSGEGMAVSRLINGLPKHGGWVLEREASAKRMKTQEILCKVGRWVIDYYLSGSGANQEARVCEEFEEKAFTQPSQEIKKQKDDRTSSWPY